MGEGPPWRKNSEHWIVTLQETEDWPSQGSWGPTEKTQHGEEGPVSWTPSEAGAAAAHRLWGLEPTGVGIRGSRAEIIFLHHPHLGQVPWDHTAHVPCHWACIPYGLLVQHRSALSLEEASVSRVPTPAEFPAGNMRLRDQESNHQPEFPGQTMSDCLESEMSHVLEVDTNSGQQEARTLKPAVCLTRDSEWRGQGGEVRQFYIL